MSKLINLCIIAEHFYPQFSGAAERFKRYLPLFKEKGIKTTVFTIWKEGLAEEEIIDTSTIKRFNINNKLTPSAELTKLVFEYFADNGNWPDIVHILSHTIDGIPFVWKFRLKGIPCINSITMYPIDLSSSFWGKSKFWLHQWLRYSAFNQIIVSSPEMAIATEKFGINSKKIVVIPNGVDLSRFYPLSSDEKLSVREKKGFSSEDKIILFVGNISYRKGVDLLILAWEKINREFPTAKLVLVGPIDKSFQYFNIVNNPTNTSRIIHIPTTGNIEKYMQLADIFIFPSRLEGMPNVIIEAMACKLPVLLTPFQGLSNTFGKPNLHYILTSFDPAQIATDAIKLMNSSEIRGIISENSYTNVVDFLNQRSSVELHTKVYRKCTQTNLKNKL